MNVEHLGDILLFLESTASPLAVAERDVTTIYSSAWTLKSPKLSRNLQQPSQNYFYEAIQVSVLNRATYTFIGKSSINTYGYIYDDYFDDHDLNRNLISKANNSDGNGEFKMTTLLQPGHRYILVATTYNPEVTGEFSVVCFGPNAVKFRLQSTSRTVSDRASGE